MFKNRKKYIRVVITKTLPDQFQYNVIRKIRIEYIRFLLINTYNK